MVLRVESEYLSDAQCSRDTVWIHHHPDKSKLVTEDE